MTVTVNKGEVVMPREAGYLARRFRGLHSRLEEACYVGGGTGSEYRMAEVQESGAFCKKPRPKTGGSHTD